MEKKPLISETEKQLILTGKMSTVFMKLAIPSLIGAVLMGLNNFLDGIFVGRFIGPNALAGVSLAFQLSMIMVGIGNMVGNGAGTALSIMLGANEENKLQRILGNVNTLSLLFALVYFIPSYIFAEPLIRMMGGEGEILQYGTQYFRQSLLGSFFFIYSLSLTNIIRGEGKLKLVTNITAIGLLVDVGLKLLFVKVLGWGVSGAAWATNLTMLLYCAIAVVYFVSGKASFKSRMLAFYFDKPMQKQILMLGFVNLIFLAMNVLQGLVVFNMIAKYGTEKDMGFYSAAFRTSFILMTPTLGIMKALQPVVGMNYGAKQYSRVRSAFEVFVKYSLFILAPIWLYMMVFTDNVIGSMLANGAYSASDILFFRINIGAVILQPFIMLSLGFLPSIEKGKEAGMVAMLNQVVLFFPLMLILPAFFGVYSIYWGSAIIAVAVFAILMLMVSKQFQLLLQKVN